MKIINAPIPKIINENQSLIILKEIKLDEETNFIGWKINYIKKINDDSDNGFHYEVDSSKEPIYDDTTKEILEKQKNKDNVESLQKMLSQSIANNAKTNAEINELKQMNANLIQSIAKLQTKEEK